MPTPAHFDEALAALGELPVFRHAIEGMAALADQGVGVGVVTLQGRERLPILLPNRVAELAQVVITWDDVTHPKPHPEGLLAALDQLGTTPDRAAFVGDTVIDIMAAQQAGVLAVGAAWGYAGRQALVDAGADVVLDSPEQVGLGLVRGLHATRYVSEE